MIQRKLSSLANLSHDLRTPLNAIIGYSEMLVEECEDRKWEGISPDLRQVNQASRALLEVIKEAFDLTRIEALMAEGDEEIIDSTLDFQIRTSMNAIVGYTEMALEVAGEEGLDELIPELEKIHTAAKLFLAQVSTFAGTQLEAGATILDLGYEDPCSKLQKTVTSTQQVFEDYTVAKRVVRGSILVVDDNPLNRDILRRYLERSDHVVEMAENGQHALEMVEEHRFDLILLDVMMPVMDGFQVLANIKADKTHRDIPVVIISALDDLENVVKGIRMGADDYLPKPFDPIVLSARVEACMERKRWRDQEQEYLAIIKAEREKSEHLLQLMLPAPIVKRLKQGESIIADGFKEVTVLFSDMVNFTPMTTQMEPRRLVMIMNDLFCMLDQLVREHGVEKIRAIGDEFVVAGGLPIERPNHAEAVADFALAMQKGLAEFNVAHRSSLSMRIGMDTGPLIAGVLGTIKFSYDLWGDAINTASRMQSHGFADRIQVTEATYKKLRGKYVLEERGVIHVKGKGEMRTYFLNGKREQA